MLRAQRARQVWFVLLLKVISDASDCSGFMYDCISSSEYLMLLIFGRFLID